MINLLTSLFTVFSTAFAAPHPGAVGSALFDRSNGMSFSNKGFILPSEGTQWRLVDSDRFELVSEKIKADKTTETLTTVLTIHTEELKKKQDIEQYSKQWLKEYSQFGFELLGTKPIGDTRFPALLVDLYHRKSDKQIRQVIRLNEKKVAILTCSHQRQGFSEILSQCNQLMEKFSWIEN
ncbi:MAG TPA: hypothetical protein PLJ21_04915 [Pseudobdellovibrionaceae bacterium]|nr:hypothetical protein [Pseudobdellovibrionaceae bacterium]